MNKPRLYVLIGISGAGKTTYCKEKLIPKLEKEGRKFVYLSSDDIREELYGDASIQGNPKQVFNIMNQKKNIALENGKDVIFDATNIKKTERVKFTLSTTEQCEKIAVFLEVTEQTAKDRQKGRDRQVSDAVIFHMVNRLEKPTIEEGFDKIIEV